MTPRSCRLAVHVVLFLLLTIPATTFAQQADPKTDREFRIFYHEALDSLKLEPGNPGALKPNSAPGDPVDAQTMTFEALGRVFELELESNDKLIANLPSQQKTAMAATMQLYRGRLNGIENSWVRLTQTGGQWSGMIWDGEEAFIIDSTTAIDPALQSKQVNGSGPGTLIYRLNDAEHSNAVCAVDPGAAPIQNYKALVNELQTTAALPAANLQLDLAVIGDAQFVAANSNPEAAVIERLNVVDGIFSEQVGVRINLIETRLLQNNGSLSSTSPSTLLSQLATFVASSGFNNPGLTHMFTNRDLDGGVIGIAFLGSLCNRVTGVGLSELRGLGTAGALTVAHELGHNFGAPHDNQGGSACAGSPGGFLMNPFSNGSDMFSQCSLNEMASNINSAFCVTEVAAAPVADVRVSLPVNPANATAGTGFSYLIEVGNNGNFAATNVSTTVSLPRELAVLNATVDGRPCVVAGNTVTCTTASIPVAAQSTIALELLGNQQGVFLSTVSVNADNDSNTANNTTEATININGTASGLFEARFDVDEDGFVYLDDAFRNTSQPLFASGSQLANTGFTGGGLTIVLGGIDNTDVLNISGGWQRSFTLATPQQVSLSFRIRLFQTSNYEIDEFSDALLAVDGAPISSTGNEFLLRVTGDGNGGDSRFTDWTSITTDLGVLSAGVHTVTIGGFNNKKTFNDETTIIFIDDVIARAAASAAVAGQPNQSRVTATVSRQRWFDFLEGLQRRLR